MPSPPYLLHGGLSMKKERFILPVPVTAELLLCVALLLVAFAPPARAADFPAAAWHRGDVSVGQENSRSAIVAALASLSPNIEVDIIGFTDTGGAMIGLLAHDYDMERVTGGKGPFARYHDITQLPPNKANPALPPEGYLSVIALFEMIKSCKNTGKVVRVSLDMKEEGDGGEAFGRWVGNLIKSYGFQEHVFASSFYPSNVTGVKAACPECMIGGLVYRDHWALRFLDYRHTSLDITGLGKATFFLGFLGKKEFPVDFVLIQDFILVAHPELIEFWKKERNVKFVGAFVHDKERPYTVREWEMLQKADWLELDPPQMHQYLSTRLQQGGRQP